MPASLSSRGLVGAQREPFGHRIGIPLRPRTRLPAAKELAQLVMLIADRLLGVDRDHVEHDRERLVLFDDALDEPVVALDRVLERGDVTAGLVKVWGARRGHAATRR